MPNLYQWYGFRRLAASAVLMLGSSGCATFTEAFSTVPAAPPVEIVQAPGDAPATVLAPPIAPAAPPAEPPAKVQPEEIRPPLKDVLLESMGLPGGKKPQYAVKSGDSLGAIADRYRVTLPMLKWANQLKTDRVRAGQKLAIPAAELRIEIDKSENRLRLSNAGRVVRVYPVATGNQGVTPTGDYKVANRLIQPTWYYQGYAIPPGDPDYPLGTRWLGLSKRGYGIHGTNEPESIGKQMSHGCVRMHNKDVEELFDVIPIGTAVSIVE